MPKRIQRRKGWIKNIIKTLLDNKLAGILLLLGLFLILSAPSYFNPKPVYKNYEFEIKNYDEGKEINGLHFDFNFDRKEVVLNFSTSTKEGKVISIDYALSLEFLALEISNETTHLVNGTDYDLTVENQTKDGQIYRKYLRIKPLRNLTGEKIRLNFTGEIYPQGNFIFLTFAKAVSNKNVEDNPIGMKSERINFNLGDQYICEAPCVSNTLPWQENNFGYILIPRKESQNVKILYKNDSESHTSLILNTFNEKKKNRRDISIALGIAFLSGGIIGFITYLTTKRKKDMENSGSKKSEYYCESCKRRHLLFPPKTCKEYSRK